MEYGFAFLIYMYESDLSSFNDWQSRLIIARCSTFVAPFRAREVFLGLITPYLSMPVVVQSLQYGCQFWTVSHKVVEHCLSSFWLYRQSVLQTDSLKLINYSCSSYPTRASYSGQVDEFKNPMKNELKTRP